MENKNKKNITLGIIVIIVIALLAWWMLGGEKAEAPIDTPNSTVEEGTTGGNVAETGASAKPSTNTQAPKPTTSSKAIAATVTYTEEGFAPSIIVIAKGETVRFVNKSTNTRMWVASGPHPSHSAYPGFDQGTSVGSGGSYDFTFTKTGKYPFHNHVDPRRTGTIVVNYE